MYAGTVFQMIWSNVPDDMEQRSILCGPTLQNSNRVMLYDKCIAKAYLWAFESRRVVVENAIEEML